MQVGRRNDDGGISGIEIDPAKCVSLMPHWFQIALEHPCPCGVRTPDEAQSLFDLVDG